MLPRSRLLVALLSLAMIWIGRSLLAQQTTSALQQVASAGPVSLVELSKPVYPPLARQAAITGIVDLVVAVDGTGTVKSVEVANGSAILKNAAVKSAWHSRFTCETCGSNTASYRMQYTFKLTKNESCSCSDLTPKSIEVSEQEADAQHFRPQAQVSAEEQQFCTCDDAASIVRKVRSAKCLYLWRCGTA